MKAFLIFIGLVLLCLCWLVYCNRGSEKIVSAALAGVVALAISIFVGLTFGTMPTERTIIPVAIYYRRADLSLITPVIGWREFPGSVLMHGTHAMFPDLFNATSRNDSLILHQFLQASILHWMAISYANWQTNPVEYRLPWGSSSRLSTSTAPKNLSPELIFGRAPDNPFLRKGAGMMDAGISVPPNTSLVISVPSASSNRGFISFTNKLLKLSINSNVAEGGVGVPALFRGELQLNQTDDLNFGYLGFVLTLETTFSVLRSGDPAMPSYKSWASSLTSGLQANFEENKLWDEFVRQKNIAQKAMAASGRHIPSKPAH